MHTNSKYLVRHHPCSRCDSTDAAVTYEDGLTHCFSCGQTYKAEKDENKMEKASNRTEYTSNKSPQLGEITDTFDCRGFAERLITKKVAEHFGCRVEYDANGNISAHYYPYTRRGVVTAYKRRGLPKSFSTVGDFGGSELFGQSSCEGGKTLVITEGELDAMAVAQANLDHYDRHYSVVSLPSASGVRALVDQLDWIRKYPEVVLMLDQDEAGQKATAECAKAIGIGKVKVAKLKEKDASDEYVKHGKDAIMRAIWDAQTYSPAGIISGTKIWDEFVKRKNTVSHPYPDCMTGVNDKVKGMRMGEIVLFTSGTGSGKSTLIKECILHLLNTTDEKIGLVSLEESPGDTAEKLIQMQIRKNMSIYPVDEDEQRKAFDEVFGDERLVLLDHQGSVSDGGLLDKMHSLAAMGCKYIILDHLTIAVSEGADGLTGNEAIDKVMSDLLKMCKQYDIWMGVISHLRKSAGGASFEEGKIAALDDMKGSGSIKQIAFDVIAFARNLTAEMEAERNIMEMSVLKSRYTGLTGPAGKARYDHETCRLTYEDISFG